MHDSAILAILCARRPPSLLQLAASDLGSGGRRIAAVVDSVSLDGYALSPFFHRTSPLLHSLSATLRRSAEKTVANLI